MVLKIAYLQPQRARVIGGCAHLLASLPVALIRVEG
jgi:hypothetical protein